MNTIKNKSHSSIFTAYSVKYQVKIHAQSIIFYGQLRLATKLISQEPLTRVGILPGLEMAMRRAIVK